MNLDHDFVQVSKLSEDQKKKFFTKKGTLFSSNSGEDQKKGLHQKWNTFFPEFKWTSYAQVHTRVKLLGGCRCRSYSNYWGGYSQIIGGDISPPGFGTPASSKSSRLVCLLLLSAIYFLSLSTVYFVTSRIFKTRGFLT